PLDVLSQRPTQSPGAGDVSPDVNTIGFAAVPTALSTPTRLFGGLPLVPNDTRAPGCGPGSFGNLNVTPGLIVSVTVVTGPPDGGATAIVPYAMRTGTPSSWTVMSAKTFAFGPKMRISSIVLPVYAPTGTVPSDIIVVRIGWAPDPVIVSSCESLV